MLYTLEERHVQLIGNSHFIADNATVIGSVILHNQVSIWFNVVIRGDNDPIVIGEDTNIQDGSVLHTDKGVPLTIGKGVTVGHLAMLHGCTIGDNSLIGINAVILNHANIGKNCIIGANALIPEGKVIPDNSLVVGSPGQVKRQLTDAELVGLQQSAKHYVENFKRYLSGLRLEGDKS
ncbi:gamma carbonic anhydrase family protein [Beggiatoa leptomitoformis]|uniref:Gamma carbonic anhydrase family protein n=1 Tax=Beggiatoa leptomitoformis TaxID=288004 RepID=A0A2N9YGP8_9GAMM|nr:gamma carbonic anhydrase family protein [Beggiatoa leptomitoformis]ALG68031.2 gamma carbonic anhydrase family protein [Beggiatoa leptomitoformis]AUI69680.2 gamma carbonic anhydrase family protein [Beggiatoa leptomitoformis]